MGGGALHKKLGYINVDWTPLIENPREWKVNGLYNLDGTEEMKIDKNLTVFGQVYLQMRFVPYDDVEDTTKAPDPEPSRSMIMELAKKEEETKINGEIIIRLIHGKGLCKADSNIQGGLADPYCKVNIVGIINENKYVSNNLNPIWKDQPCLRFKVNITKSVINTFY